MTIPTVDQLIALRRRLHRVAEVGLDLPRTQQMLLEALDGLPVEILLGKGLSSVTAVLRGARPGPVVLLRSDMDGLPIVEQTGLDFAAEQSAMHACGHDLHMAAMVGAIHRLAAVRDQLAGTVVFAFQPGEEGHGGAGLMLAEGLLDVAGQRPVAAYALHVIADLPRGIVHSRSGPIMAAYQILEVEVTGRGAHGGRPHEGADPVPVIAEIVGSLHQYVDRRFDAFDPVVITVGELEAGTAPNVVAASATLRAGVRTFSETNTARVAEELPRLVRGIASAHGIEARAQLRAVMAPTINDPDHHEILARAAIRLFGEDRYRTFAHPRSGSEDFSEMLRAVPGAFGYVGAAVDTTPHPVGNHSPYSQFDDSVIDDAAALLVALAEHHLIPGSP